MEQLAAGAARGKLAARSAGISAGYRSRSPSAAIVASAADAVAYAITRLPATYAAIEAALIQAADRIPDFSPRSLLDLGCGPGTASWAATETWPDIATATLLDRNPHFLATARSLAAQSEHTAISSARIVTGDLTGSALSDSHDLVLLGYALTELPDAALARTVEQAWQRCTGLLLMVEPGTPRDYARLAQIRQHLIAAGATVVAPCPHTLSCPLVAPDWCHFSVRLARSRDHVRLKGGTLGYEDEKFSYLAVARPSVMPASATPRVLARPISTKHDVTLKLCTPEGTAISRSVSKRDPVYRAAKKLDWGDSAGT